MTIPLDEHDAKDLLGLYDSIYGRYLTSASSPYASEMTVYYDSVISQFLSDNVTGGRLRSAIEKINEIYEDCSEDNWDAYGAYKVSEGAYIEAKKFIQLLPSGIPLPHVAPNPSGGLLMEWHKDKDHVLAINVSGNGWITYASLLGYGTRNNGTIYFGNSLPKYLVENTKRMIEK